MFGGEQGGFAHARADLWANGAVAVCDDGAENHALESIVALHEALGAHVVMVGADEHDRVMAIVSHVPFLVAHAFERIGNEYGPRVQQLAGRTFADITRVAHFSFEIQGEVAKRNPHLESVAKQLTVGIEQVRSDFEGRS
jgi:prephenate dehydrogenase